MAKEIRQKSKAINNIIQVLFDEEETAKFFGRTDGKILVANKAACNLFGYSKKEFLNINRSYLMAPETLNNYIPAIRNKKKTKSGILYFRRKNGEIFQGKYSSTLTKDVLGEDCASITIVELYKKTGSLQVGKNQRAIISTTPLNSAVIYGTINKSGNSLFISDSVQNIFGYSAEELTGKSFTDLIYAGDKAKTAKLIAEMDQLKVYEDFRNRVIYKDGTLKTISWNYKYIEQTETIHVTGRYLTNGKQSEAGNIDSSVFLGAYADFGTDAIFVHDEEGRFIDVNWQACRNLGYTREELLSMTVMDIELNYNLTSARAQWDKIKPNEPFLLESCQIRKDRTILPVEIQFGCFYVKNKKLFLVFVRDITERKQAEIQNKKNEDEYRALIEKMRFGVLKQGPNAEILISNDAAAELLGLSKDQLAGKTTFDPDWNVIHEDGSNFLAETHPVAAAIKTKMPVRDVIMGVYRPVTKDRVWLLVNAEPELDDYGNVDHVICSFQDITNGLNLNNQLQLSSLEQNRLMKALQIKSSELLNSNAQLEQFAYVASHDLQEPLRMVTSFLKMLDNKYSAIIDDKGKSYINFAVDGAERMKELISDLLSYSRVGNKDRLLEIVNLETIINEIKNAFFKQIEENKAQIITNNLPVFKGFRTQIKQIFSNLISNALKYRQTENPPIIEIDWTETALCYQFSVKDNGIGISNENFDRIFEVFQRLHNSEKYKGTGIGLAIVKKIVDQMDGKIWLQSEPEKGSVFYFTILKQKSNAK